MTAGEVQSGSVRSGDVDIFCRRFGKSGPNSGRTPVLIVHGLSYFSYDWIGPASALASDREVAAIDMRGFGQSGWSPSRNYKLETLVGDVLNVLDALGWRQAVLIGHSFGGRVALATAGWNAVRAAAVVLVDFAPDIAAAGRRATAERIGRQPDVFASVGEALAFHEEDDTPAVRARYEAFLKPVEGGFRSARSAFPRQFQEGARDGAVGPGPGFFLADARGAQRTCPGDPWLGSPTCSTRQRSPK